VTLVASTVVAMNTTSDLTTLVILFGGQSAEHDVSCVTAAQVFQAVNPSRFHTVAIGIDKAGQWHHVETRGGVDKLMAQGPPASASDIVSLNAQGPVVVVPLIHGPLGEDGTVQGLLEVLNLAYVGSGVLSSAVAMDKGVAKALFSQAGIPQARHIVLRDDQATSTRLNDAASELGYPLFVKPANMGSSVGVTKAHDFPELERAVEIAASYDEWIVIEEFIIGREIEVAVLGNRQPRASLPGEISPGKEFYDYEDKYVSDTATLTIPAHLSSGETEIIRALAIRAYEALHCEGMARVDFFYEENGRGFLCNEINTIPGFTPISMYPKMWEATGLSYTELIDELVDLAQERYVRRKRNTAR
jgi:D-alanine-D-alanine ligase